MKKIILLCMLTVFSMMLFSCENEEKGIDIFYRPLVESKYNVTIEKVYYTVNINPYSGEAGQFKYLPSQMATAFRDIYFETDCVEPNWMQVTYIKTDQGDKLVYHILRVKKDADPNLAVVMIDYPFAYTFDEMMTFVQNIDLNFDFAIDESYLSFNAQSFYGLQTNYCSGSFVIEPITNSLIDLTSINPDEFIWVLNYGESIESTSNNDAYHTLWLTISPRIIRLWYSDNQVFITYKNQDNPEEYIYPYQRLVVSIV
jgi:hypothetical protein